MRGPVALQERHRRLPHAMILLLPLLLLVLVMVQPPLTESYPCCTVSAMPMREGMEEAEVEMLRRMHLR
jgi:hypothetical protein